MPGRGNHNGAEIFYVSFIKIGDYAHQGKLVAGPFLSEEYADEWVYGQVIRSGTGYLGTPGTFRVVRQVIDVDWGYSGHEVRVGYE